MEPFFTFAARIPPYELPRLTPRQIHTHIEWWAKHRPAEGGDQ